jgi:hypothetical protein
VCKQHATYHCKFFNKGYNFTLDLIAIRGLHKMLCTFKVTRAPIIGISELPLGSAETKKTILMWPPWRAAKYTIRGGFPQVQAVVNLVCSSCLWLILTPKVLQLCTDHFVLVSCRSVWMIEACHFFLVPSWNSNTPFYPSIVLRTKECASTFCSSIVFSLGTRIWVPQGVRSASMVALPPPHGISKITLKIGTLPMSQP